AANGRTGDVDHVLLPNVAVRALLRRSDTLWVGSDAGLSVLVPGSDELHRTRASSLDPRVNFAVVAMGTSDSVVVVATATGDVLRVHTRTGALLDTLTMVSTQRVGRITGLAVDAHTVWVSGPAGLVGIRRDTKAQRFLAVGIDLP